MEVFRRLGAPLVIAQKGAFQMDPGALSAVGAMKVPDNVHGGGKGFLLQRHGGSQVGGDPVSGIVVGQGLHPFGLAVREVLPHGAVGMHVHQAGDDIAALGVPVGLALQSAHSLNGLAEPDIAL